MPPTWRLSAPHFGSQNYIEARASASQSTPNEKLEMKHYTRKTAHTHTPYLQQALESRTPQRQISRFSGTFWQIQRTPTLLVSSSKAREVLIVLILLHLVRARLSHHIVPITERRRRKRYQTNPKPSAQIIRSPPAHASVRCTRSGVCFTKAKSSWIFGCQTSARFATARYSLLHAAMSPPSAGEAPQLSKLTPQHFTSKHPTGKAEPSDNRLLHSTTSFPNSNASSEALARVRT